MTAQPNVIASTEPGTTAPDEIAAIEAYGLRDRLKTRFSMRIEVEGGEVHLDVFPPQGDNVTGPLVFIPGLSAHALMYAGCLEELAEAGIPVVALDLRGHGRSSGARGDFTIASGLTDIAAAIAWARATYPGELTVFGTSLGGFWSLLAANALDGIDRAVSHWIMLPDMPVTPRDRIALPVGRLLARVAPNLGISTRLLARWDEVCDDPALRQAIDRDPLMVWKYTARAVASATTYQPPRPLERLRVPHLVIIGQRDRMTPLSYTQRVFDRLEGDKQLCIVPDAGHMGGLVEHRAEVVDAVVGWVRHPTHVESPAPA